MDELFRNMPNWGWVIIVGAVVVCLFLYFLKDKHKANINIGGISGNIGKRNIITINNNSNNQINNTKMDNSEIIRLIAQLNNDIAEYDMLSKILSTSDIFERGTLDYKDQKNRQIQLNDQIVNNSILLQAQLLNIGNQQNISIRSVEDAKVLIQNVVEKLKQGGDSLV